MAKEKYTIEFMINCSTRVLYSRLSTAGGLTEWFADNVTLSGKIFTFTWNGVDQIAELISKKDQKYVRFRWIEDEKDTYFEFNIVIEELTGGVALIITDFAEKDEIDDAKDLWDSQINELKHMLGG